MFVFFQKITALLISVITVTETLIIFFGFTDDLVVVIAIMIIVIR